MSKTKFLNLEVTGELGSLIDTTALRNRDIKIYYEALQDSKPELNFEQKIKRVARKFGLSKKSIEAIICSFVKKKK